MNEERVRQIIQEELDKYFRKHKFDQIHQSQIAPDTIKRRHINDKVIVFGTSRPDDNTTGVDVYFNTSTGTLSLYDGSAWVDIPRIPASPATYTPSNVTTDRAWDCDTVAVAELADVVATLVADLQSIGLVD